MCTPELRRRSVLPFPIRLKRRSLATKTSQAHDNWEQITVAPETLLDGVIITIKIRKLEANMLSEV